MTKPRLIEHYIPIKAISAEAKREKSIRHGHISTLHLWWARRPLVASRAAVFAALVPADAQPQLLDADGQPYSLNKLMIELCKWELDEAILAEARRLIAEAHPDGPPNVLDMFAGGGSIPLEALRLGARAYALDLNPVAHIIELATLVYPQQYGARLAQDVRHWGEWVLERVRAEVGDLYPPLPAHLVGLGAPAALRQSALWDDGGDEAQDDEEPNDEDEEFSPEPYRPKLGAEPPAAPQLQPIAYLWTRTVRCSNPACGAIVPLVRQTWLKKKAGDYVALEVLPHPTEPRAAFHVRRAATPQGLGFDPAGYSKRGNSQCVLCGSTATNATIKAEGRAGRLGAQLMAVVGVLPGQRGKHYLSPDDFPHLGQHQVCWLPDDAAIRARIAALTAQTGITPPDEPLPEKLTGGMCTIYGLDQFYKLFTPRQLLTLLTFVKEVRQAHAAMLASGLDADYAKAVTTYLGLTINRVSNYNSTLCVWNSNNDRGVVHTFGRQALPMTWDFPESNPIADSGTGWSSAIKALPNLISAISFANRANVYRGSATRVPLEDAKMEAVITDPPYYDNISYADLSDYFYVWLKRSLSHIYCEHFGIELTPKRNEAIAASYRHEDEQAARTFYEDAMRQAFREANRVLKDGGMMVTVYAHKTTAGWSTLVDSMRQAGFQITEAWPLDTELTGHLKQSAFLASSLFLVARKRPAEAAAAIGDYVQDVLPAMQRIVAERVRFFLEMGISGADLNIAAVGAGLAPYTRYERVELPNGDPLSASTYLDAVQREVARALLGESARTDPKTQYA
ncbi:MAG: DUF1156 domain-containing protein, partial [Anaerolineae bacterium]|nr:DUF1156 domain-containing protein [Anaerolineae bacterium]MDW8173735.1 DUF1156 domain-containing protein [Anaerolineae bacterium]